MMLKKYLNAHPVFNIILGIAFAVMAGLLLLVMVSSAVSGNSGGKKVRVPVASRNIEMGTAVRESWINYKRIPEDYVTPGTIIGPGNIVGSNSLRFIGKGEPFTRASLSGAGSKGTMASRIPTNLRAYTLRPGTGSAAGTDLRPGDRVDVLSTYGDPPATSTLLKGRFILNIGKGGSSTESGSSTSELSAITLLVSPSEVELLAQAEFIGEISISLCPIKQQ